MVNLTRRFHAEVFKFLVLFWQVFLYFLERSVHKLAILHIWVSWWLHFIILLSRNYRIKLDLIRVGSSLLSIIFKN